MAKYKVYLTLNGIRERKRQDFEDKESIKECIKKASKEKNEEGKNKYNGYTIIMNLEGTDIPVSRGTFTDAEVIIDGLDDEWRILENGFPQNYTKYKKFQEEAKKKGTDKVRQGIDER